MGAEELPASLHPEPQALLDPRPQALLGLENRLAHVTEGIGPSYHVTILSVSVPVLPPTPSIMLELISNRSCVFYCSELCLVILDLIDPNIGQLLGAPLHMTLVHVCVFAIDTT